MRNLMFTAMLMLYLAAPAAAGHLAPALESRMAGLADQDIIKVLVVMEDQPDIAGLDKSLHAVRAPRAERHHTVVSTLQRTADDSQLDLIRTLDADKAAGGILGYTSYWIINSLVVRGTVAAVRELSLRPDVKVIEPDLQVELIEPVMTKRQVSPAEMRRGEKGVAGFVAQGVTAIGADRVWHELGITGTGSLVANLDSGVDASHPALGPRWRGNTADAATAWLDVADVGSPTFPYDGVGHGTHVMGTMMGATAFDTVGVAPGAQWIAANAIVNSTSQQDFINQVLESFQWIADPDGDPATSDDVPDVCHNSWGATPDMGFPDCNTIWWSVIDNCEAAGVVITFSAGNEGPTPGTIRSPGDRATSPSNCFTIGSTAPLIPFEVSQFSSRGPSGCGGEWEIKPEVMAPGESIYSTYPGGGYVVMDGTSMAGPHVAGVVALMREAAPDLDVTTIKEVLMSTAIDLGIAGEDNSYGHGFVDAYAAVSLVLASTGGVMGTITDYATGLPIAGATIRDLRGFSSTRSKADGTFSLTILSGETTFRIENFGYDTIELPLTIPSGGDVTLNATLVPMAPAVVAGVVLGPDNTPIAGATVSALDTPVDPVVSDATGAYSITLPASEIAAYDLMALAPDLAYEIRHIGLQGDRTVDFALPDLQFDGFESGGLATYPWQTGGNEPWFVGDNQAYEGVLSVQSGPIGDGGTSELSVEWFVQDDDIVSFWYRTDSETLYDALDFYLDGVVEESWSGATDWSQYVIDVTAGAHTLRWVYRKDSSASAGADAVWIDLVEFPGTGEALLPALTLDRTTVAISVDAGQTASAPLEIGNTGGYRLDYATTPTIDGDAGLTWITTSPTADTVHPGSIRNITINVDGGRVGSGNHVVDLVISSNDPDHPDTTVTIDVTVAAVSGVGNDLPHHLAFQGAVPNPFNPATDIKFSLPQAGDVSLRVYDVSGRLVRTLLAQRMAAGHHSERWDGHTDNGRAVASGIYYARLVVAGETNIKPMTLVR